MSEAMIFLVKAILVVSLIPVGVYFVAAAKASARNARWEQDNVD